MGRGPRLGVIIAAIVIAAIAFVLLRPEGDDDQPLPTRTTGDTRPGNPTAPVPKPPPFETIRLAGGEVEGGERRITVTRGEVARIEVRSDAPDEIHLHGYDVYKDVAPGKPARFRVKTDKEGVFEIEAHDLGHVIIGSLVVEP